MKLHDYRWLAFLILATASSSTAAEISGKVRDAGADNVTVVIEGDALPAIGDSAKIFFKLPGADEEISVASGKVAAVEANVVKLKIEESTGAIEKDQLARIKSASSPQAPAASPSPASSPSTKESANPIRGDWTGTHHSGGAKISLSFKDDNTLLYVVESPESAQSVTAKYRVDTSVTPHIVELSDFDSGEMKGHTVYGLFELQSDGRLKFDVGETRDRGFDERETIFLSHATSPIVRPNKPAPPAPTLSQATTPFVASTPSPAEAALPQPSAAETSTPSLEVRQLIDKGIALKDGGDLDAAVKALTQAIKLDPEAVDAYWWRGSCYDLKNDHTAAIRDWTEIGRLDPSQRESRQKVMDDLHWPEKAKKEQQSKKR